MPVLFDGAHLYPNGAGIATEKPITVITSPTSP